MKQAAFIVSFLGDDRSSVLYEKRLSYHRRQLRYLLTEKNIERVYVYAQCYNDAERSLHTVCEAGEVELSSREKQKLVLIESDQPQHPGIGRNVLLKEFYSSEYDWGHFIDNDSILYDHFFGKNVFVNLEKVADDPQMRFVAGFRPIIPRHEAFTAEYEANKEVRDNSFVFTRDSHLKGSFFSIRNFKKYDNVEIYMDESMFQMEDDEFALAMLSHGLVFYKCHNVVLNELANGVYSVLFANQDRMQDVQQWKNYIAEKYSEYGVKLNSKGNVDRKSFVRRIRTPKQVVISINNKKIALDKFF